MNYSATKEKTEDLPFRTIAGITTGLLVIMSTIFYLTGIPSQITKDMEESRLKRIEIERVETELQQAQDQRIFYTAGTIPWFTISRKAERKNYFEDTCKNTYRLHPGNQVFIQCVQQEEHILGLKSRLQEIKTR